MNRRARKAKGPANFERKQRILLNADELVDSFASLGINQPTNATDFYSIGLNPDLLRGIHALGLERPAGIQQKAIIPCIKGKDVILQAQSGMGKTAAFCIGSLQQVHIDIPDVQVLVVTPTRELAEQIHNTFLILGRYMKVNCITCVGGTQVAQNREELDEEVHIVCGTLGRLLHLSSLGSLNLDTVKTLIFDESDKMLTDRTFRTNMSKLIASINGNTQIILSSATMPPDAISTARTFMHKPIPFLLDNTELTLEGIKQFYVKVNTEMDKLETLVDLYPIISKSHTMIFASTRGLVKLIKTRLLEKNIDIGFIVGTAHQMDRNKILADFRNMRCPVILTSDLLGRGIDVQQVYAVINFDLPMFHVDYIHRVGRCGRYGRKGVAINLVTSEEKVVLDEISSFFGTNIMEMPTDIAKHF